MIIWTIIGNISWTVLCRIVYHNCAQWYAYTGTNEQLLQITGAVRLVLIFVYLFLFLFLFILFLAQ